MLGDWSAVVAHLAATHREVREFPGQRMRFTHAASGAPIGGFLLDRWMAFAIKICPLARLRTREAMLVNAELPAGAIATMMDQVVVRQSLPLGATDAASLEAALAALVTVAAEVRPDGPRGARLYRS